MRFSKEEILEQIKGQLIVSCQALPHEPLYVEEKSIMYLMARAAKQAGAKAIRTSSVRDVEAIKAETGLPVIGIIKINYEGYDSYITPTMKEVDELVAAEADIIALDCTQRPRGDGSTINDFLAQIKEKYPDVLLMADISTYEEGVNARNCGVDFVGTTLSGYTDYSPKVDGPDFELVRRLARDLDIPVIAEGKVHYPAQAAEMLRCGAFAVVVGGAITRPLEITARFMKEIEGFHEAQGAAEEELAAGCEAAVTNVAAPEAANCAAESGAIAGAASGQDAGTGIENAPKTYLGIDIGGTAVKMGLVTDGGEMLDTTSAPVDFDGYETPIIETVVETARAFLQKNGLEHTLSGIGVSATGQIDTKTGEVIGAAGHIKNWLHTPLGGRLRAEFGCPVAAANDANCAVLGEQWMGAAKGCENVLMITVGTGIGGGVIVNGQLLNGATGAGGELGHFIIYKDGERCACGNVGCFERHASVPALIRRVKAHPDFERMGIPADNVNGRTIFAQVEQGNQPVIEVVNGWIEDISVGLVGLIHVFNPELVLIGGGVSEQQALFVEPVKKRVFELAMPEFVREMELRAAALGNRAGLYGAVANLLQREIRK